MYFVNHKKFADNLVEIGQYILNSVNCFRKRFIRSMFSF